MNMHFQLNLTSSDHVVAARLRIFKLPQENLTSSAGDTFEEDEEDEKKIRISVYYYTKSLKKHRCKLRELFSNFEPVGNENRLATRAGWVPDGRCYLLSICFFSKETFDGLGSHAIDGGRHSSGPGRETEPQILEIKSSKSSRER